MNDETANNREALHRLGVALGIFAAGLVVLATFLPRLHSPTIGVPHNQLIHRREGLWFLVFAAVIMMGSIGAMVDRRAGRVVLLAGIAVFALTFYSATGSRSVVFEEIPGVADSVYGDPGLGLITGAVSGLMAAGSGLLIASKD